MANDNMAPVPTTAKIGGHRSLNYKIDEDMKVASAYVHVTTTTATTPTRNAAAAAAATTATISRIDGRTLFWDKVRHHFLQHGGTPNRSAKSLQNRFHKVLHAEIQHYVEHLHSALCKYHRGWSKYDYVTQAKSMYESNHGKQFQHDIVHDILKRALPTYDIDTSIIDSRVCHALFQMDRITNINNNISAAADRDARGEDSYGIPLVRPVGIKKAKRLAFMAAAAMAKHKKKKQEMEERAARQQRTADALHRLANAAKASNAILQEKLMLQVFSVNPHSDESRAYFNRIGVRHIIHDPHR